MTFRATMLFCGACLLAASWLPSSPAIAGTADANRYLPLAGLTADQVESTMQSLAQRHNQTLDPAQVKRTLKLLSSKPDCSKLGLLCGLAGKEQVPDIIRATWAAQAGGADYDQTVAAFDKAVTRAIDAKTKNLDIAQLDRLQVPLAKAIRANGIDPSNYDAVHTFVLVHSPQLSSLPLSWLPNINVGAHIRCQKGTWSDTHGWPWNWKFRIVAGCAGDVWGETNGILGFPIGYIWIGNVSAYGRGICYCIPQTATPIKTTITFQSVPFSASTNSWFIYKGISGLYAGTKSGSYAGQSSESSIPSLSYSDGLGF